MNESINSFTISGVIKNSGPFGKMYPHQWITIGLDNIDLPMDDGSIRRVENSIFVLVSLSTNPTGNYKRNQEYLIANAVKGKFIVIQNLKLTKYKFANKAPVATLGGSTAQQPTVIYEEKPCLKCNPNNVIIKDEMIPVSYNIGIIEGQVVKQGGNKLLVEQRVKTPNGFVNREIRLLSRKGTEVNAVGKSIFAVGSISGVDPNSTESRPSPFAVCDYYIVK